MTSMDERAVLQNIFNWNDTGAQITLIGFAANSFLTLMKGLAGWYLNSASLLAEATHGTSDMLADVVILCTWTLTRQRSSTRWPFGCGKVETLISACVATSMIIASLGVGAHSASIFIKIASEGDEHAVPDLNSHAAWFALCGVGLKEYLYRKTTSVAKEQSSSILMAYAEHHRADALTSLVALASILCTSVGFKAIDSVGGILASLAIIAASLKVLLMAFYELLDVGVSDEVLRELHECAGEWNTPVASIRATTSGGQMVVYVNLNLDEKMSLEDFSNASQRVRGKLLTQRHDISDVFMLVNPL